MNTSQSEMIISMFDLRKLSRTCNYKDCKSPPSKEILLYETDLITNQRKEAVSLYFCTKHYNIASVEIVRKLNEIGSKRWVVGKKEFDVGYVTH
jgi:hypothetical protein